MPREGRPISSQLPVSDRAARDLGPWARWEALEAVAAAHGPSFYLADTDRFEGNCRRFLQAFRARYPRTSIGYSYKTNYLPEFIRQAHALGAYSEVVSRFELDLAMGLGVPGDRVLFNGPVKRADDLATALAAGSIVNADSIPETRELRAVAATLDREAAVGVRCHLGPETDGTRFGIDLLAPDGAEAVAALAAAPNVRLAGLHCHQSGDRSAAQYRRRARAMIALHQDVLGGRPLDFLDLGGGFAGPMAPELASQLASRAASFEEYGDAVAGEARAAYGHDGPELILEPGMALLADTMVFATRVEAVKDQGRRLAVVDGSGLNIQPPWNLFRRDLNLPVRVVAGPSEELAGHGPWDVVGHTCIEGDVLHQGYEGPIATGDFVLVRQVGAYTNVLGAPFIRGTPPIVTLEDGQPGRLLRRASTARDLLDSYAPEERR